MRRLYLYLIRTRAGMESFFFTQEFKKLKLQSRRSLHIVQDYVPIFKCVWYHFVTIRNEEEHRLFFLAARNLQVLL